MFYTPKITNPEEGLDAILVAAERFDVNRFLYAVQYKNYDENQLERMANEIAFYHSGKGMHLEKSFGVLYLC